MSQISSMSRWQISRDDWSVTVNRSGLVTLDDLRWITGSNDDVPVPAVHLRARTRAEAVTLLTMIAEGRFEELNAAPWVSSELLPPYERDLFGESP